jgi:MFS family permease
LGALPTPRRIGISALILIGFSGLMMALFGVVTNLLVIIVVGVLMGLCIGYVNVMTFSAIQKLVAPEAMGRVMSLLMMASFGLGPISQMVAGFLVDVNLSGMFVGAGIILMVITILASGNREMRGFVSTTAAPTTTA